MAYCFARRGLLVLMMLAGMVAVAKSQSITTQPSRPDGARQAPMQDVAMFLRDAEERLERLLFEATLAAWEASVNSSDVTEARTTAADVALSNENVRLAITAQGLSSSAPEDQRKLLLLRLWASGQNKDRQAALRRAELVRQMDNHYEQTPVTVDPNSSPMSRIAIEREVRTERNPERLRRLWEGWYDTTGPQRQRYLEYTDLLNQGARDSGLNNAAEVSLAAYEVDPATFERELQALWDEVRPLYRLLHAYARERLAERYPGYVDPRGLIPIHLTGNLWGQDWEAIADILLPGSQGGNTSSAEAFLAAGLTPRRMAEVSVGFFESLGFAPLPPSFWQHSFFEQPLGPDGRPRPNFACHPTAYNIRQGDWRVRACFEPSWASLLTAHHEIGHIFYYQAFNHQPVLFRDAANAGINEAVGDAVMLSVTPSYLSRIGIGSIAPADDDRDTLLRVALRKLVRIPFGLALQRWRWGIQSGRISPARANEAWWELVAEYQGLAPPGPRPPGVFDPAAKKHIAADIDYVRYFLADVLTFQIHSTLIRDAGCTDAIHRCSAYGSAAAGERFRRALAFGSSRPWQESLEIMTGSSEIRGEPLRQYLAPLEAWLRDQTHGLPVDP